MRVQRKATSLTTLSLCCLKFECARPVLPRRVFSCLDRVMPVRPPQHRLGRQRTKQDRDRDHDRRRTEDQPWRRWYWTPRWRRLAKAQLAASPLCRMCEADRKLTPATVCDHVTPHRGDEVLFWAGPFQSLCKACHDGAKQSEERLGYVKGCDASGRPKDAGHPWNRQR